MAGNRGFRWVNSDFGHTSPPVQNLAMKCSTTFYNGQAVKLSAAAGICSVGLPTAADTALYGYIVGDHTTTASEKTTRAQIVPFIPGHNYEVVGASSTMTGVALYYLNLRASLQTQTGLVNHRLNTAATFLFKIVGYKETVNTAFNSTATGAGRKWIVQILSTACQYSQTTEA